MTLHDFLHCSDFWLNRYQTLLTGAAALVATRALVRLSEKQVSIMGRQEKIMADQQQQTKALATLRVDEALRGLETQRHWVLSKSLGSRDNWAVNNPEAFRLPSPIDDLTSAATLAFPERAAELANLFHTAAELSLAYTDFLDDPWQNEVVIRAMDWTEEKRQQYRLRGDAAAETVRKFMDAWGKVADLSPGVRLA